jgi:hypothetical protein
MDFFIRIGKGSYHESTPQTTFPDVVNYESIKRELKRRLIYEYRCDDRLKTKNEESTRLADTGFPCRKRGLRPRFRHGPQTTFPACGMFFVKSRGKAKSKHALCYAARVSCGVGGWLS